MQLKTFTPDTTPNVRASAQIPQVTLYLKNGVFAINKSAAEVIGVASGNQIMLHQDEENPEDWYIEKVKDNGFPLRCKNGDVAPLVFNNSALVREICNSVDFGTEEHKGCKVRLAKEASDFEGRTLWCIMMTSAEARV